MRTERVLDVVMVRVRPHGTTPSRRALGESREPRGRVHHPLAVLGPHQPGELTEGESPGQRPHGRQPHSGLAMLRRGSQHQIRALDHLGNQSAGDLPGGIHATPDQEGRDRIRQGRARDGVGARTTEMDHPSSLEQPLPEEQFGERRAVEVAGAHDEYAKCGHTRAGRRRSNRPVDM